MRARAIVVLAALVVACSGPAATERPTTPGARSLPTPTITAEAGLVADGELSDKKRDVDDGDGGSAPQTAHVDIVKVTAAADGADLRIRVFFARDVPPKLSSFEQEISYAIYIETDTSGEVDYDFIVGNLEAGRWALVAWPPDLSESDALAVVDGFVALTIPLEALGNPEQLRLGVVAQRAEHSDGSVVGEDRAPNNAFSMSPTANWLTLGE